MPTDRLRNVKLIVASRLADIHHHDVREEAMLNWLEGRGPEIFRQGSSGGPAGRCYGVCDPEASIYDHGSRPSYAGDR
jgi:hypothetical protein